MVPDIIKRNKESIIIGLLTSLVFLLFEKIVSFGINIIIPLLISLNKTFSNFYYKHLPLNTNFSNEFTILLILSALLITLGLNRIAPSESKKEIIVKNLEMIIVIITMGVVTVVIYNVSIDRENKKFKNKLIALKPYITQNQIDTLNSQWVLMKNQTDYKQIDSTLNNLLKINKLNFY